MVRIMSDRQNFESFVGEIEARLGRALVAAFGPEVGNEVTRDALAYAWEHWDRLSTMDNPVGYLYRVGQSRSRTYRKRRIAFPAVHTDELPHVEPGLPAAMARLTSKQRTAVVLLHVEAMTERDAAESMRVSRAALRRHADRGMAKLRQALEVEDAG